MWGPCMAMSVGIVEKTVPQVALKWLLHQQTVSSVIIGAKKMEQLIDNVLAGDDSWQLSADQASQISNTQRIQII